MLFLRKSDIVSCIDFNSFSVSIINDIYTVIVYIVYIIVFLTKNMDRFDWVIVGLILGMLVITGIIESRIIPGNDILLWSVAICGFIGTIIYCMKQGPIFKVKEV